MPEVHDTVAEPTGALPTGTVTFVMTDIEGSTRLLQALGDRFSEVLTDHHRLLRDALGSGGTEVAREGDAFFFAFRDAPSAVRAALDAQRLLAAHPWPRDSAVRVRIGIHTGEGKLLGADDYVGLDVHRTARIAAAGHGGQVLLSATASALVEAALPEQAALRDLGEHRLKDLDRAEHLFQLVAPGLQDEFPPVRSLDPRRHNMPAQITSFVGREREAKQVVELLRSCRLLTLTGPGGTGKTRLAIEVAAGCAGEFVDGVHFVPLAAITDAELVVPTIAATFNVREGPARPIRQGLADHLRDRVLLLVLDNFEQVTDAAPNVGELLAAAAGLKVLVTSREPLRIAGEQELPVPPLPLPTGGADVGLDELRAVESVALFVQRARSVRPDFQLTQGNAQAVATICTRLDGLPLALELAAARTRLFQPPELLAQLERCLSFLSGGRDLPERHRTLRGAIDWSHDLLSDDEQALFRRLAVFSGGATLQGVDAVCGGDGLDVLDGLMSLHDKSLLRRDDTAGEFRVMMLETIREYARERLEASGEAPDVTARHVSYYVDLAERAAPHLRGPDQQRWLATLDRELDNIRAILRYSIESGNAEQGLGLAATLTQFWLSSNHMKESRAYLDQLLALPSAGETPASRAAALEATAEITGWQGDHAAVRPLAEEALALYRELGDTRGIASILGTIGYTAIVADPPAAIELFTQSIEAYRKAGSPATMGGSLVGLGTVHLQLGNLDEAVANLEDAERHLRDTGDEDMRFVPIGLLGLAARFAGDLAGARRRFVEVLRRARPAGRQLGLQMGLSFLADLALDEGAPEHAAILADRSRQLIEQLGGVVGEGFFGGRHPDDVAREALGEERYEAVVALARSLSLDEVVELAIAGPVERQAVGRKCSIRRDA